ncbi:MAG: glycosyltransferase family 2 protein [Candidatus Micrarchaeaceae archaeon]
MLNNHKPLVSVIIPTFNRSTQLEKCINSVFESDYKNIELIITDDNSNDDSRKKILKKYKKMKILYLYSNKKKFLSYNLNKAIKKSNGELILKLDDDNTLNKNAISQLVYFFLKNKDLGVAGPVALYSEYPNFICHAGVTRSKIMRRAIYPYSNLNINSTLSEVNIEDFTNVFMFRRKVLHLSGLMDLSIPYMGEDSEFQARVVKSGYMIKLCNKAFVYHNIPFKNERYFIRFDKFRLYHTMRSKIIYEMRYAKKYQKITFTLSIPIYLSYYASRIILNEDKPKNKLSLFLNVIKGTWSGYIDSIKRKTNIEYLD